MKIWSSVKRAVVKEAPILLTLTGISGFVAGAVMAVKAAPFAQEANQKWWMMEGEYGTRRWNRRTARIQTVKNMLPYYAPAVGVMMMSAAALLGSAHVSRQRYIAVSALQMATQGYLDRFKDAVEDNVTKKKKDDIYTQAATPDLDVPEELLHVESTVFWDDFSKRYFRSAGKETVRGILNDMNQVMFLDGWVPLNDFYYGVGLETLDIGDQLGWAIEGGAIDVGFYPVMKNERPVVSVVFSLEPKHIYARLGG